ncbi:phi X174 lysis protein [Hartmannibacter diazotrophicus]|uniref:Protein SlyX homolog n=1 Tax=Hartmannibacter diazotrophicus TaxID=1482074 RepID=A0A2C9DCP0_9HYPH|nr:SlyX family protein [Hartmannibacter diazotrophicus]SON57501.1 phi X174 lysis protein [Hartmannibacter diazotrophicus]
MTDSDSARIDALEMKIAHQDEVIEDLNRTITAQWSEIDQLKKAMATLFDRLHHAEGRLAATAPPEPPPPHY